MRRIVVIGSGRMAPGIAAGCSTTGARVLVAARNAAKAGRAARSAGELTEGAVRAAPLEAATFADASLAIETIVEDLETKIDLLKRVEAWLPDQAILATNTSSLPLSLLARGLSRPDRFAALHFLHPAHLTGVVEIVPAPATSTSTPTALAELARQMGKQPILLRRDMPGFLWNRLQFAMLRECLHLLDAGVADVSAIDTVVSDGLAPRWLAGGPLATADLGGLETFQRVAKQLFPMIARETEVSDALAHRARDGQGFYHWTDSRLQRIEALRADLLAATREASERRRAALPPPNESLGEPPEPKPALTAAPNRWRIAVLTSALAAWNTEQAFAEARAAGVDGLEVVYPGPADPPLSASAVEDIGRLASAHGVEICGLAAPVGCAIGTPEVVAALRAAQELGAPWVRVFAPPFAHRGPSAAVQLARLAQAIEATLANAGAGVTPGMLVELSQDTLLPSPELAQRVLEPLGERVGVVFDPANMLVEGNLAPEYAVSLLSGLLRHVHVKNSVIPLTPARCSFRSVPLERGLVDWPHVIRALLDQGYIGWFSIDRLSGATTRQRLRRDVAALRRVLVDAIETHESPD